MKKYKKIFSGLGLLSITTLMGASIVACSPKEDPKAPETEQKPGDTQLTPKKGAPKQSPKWKAPDHGRVPSGTELLGIEDNINNSISEEEFNRQIQGPKSQNDGSKPDKQDNQLEGNTPNKLPQETLKNLTLAFDEKNFKDEKKTLTPEQQKVTFDTFSTSEQENIKTLFDKYIARQWKKLDGIFDEKLFKDNNSPLESDFKSQISKYYKSQNWDAKTAQQILNEKEDVKAYITKLQTLIFGFSEIKEFGEKFYFINDPNNKFITKDELDKKINSKNPKTKNHGDFNKLKEYRLSAFKTLKDKISYEKWLKNKTDEFYDFSKNKELHKMIDYNMSITHIYKVLDAVIKPDIKFETGLNPNEYTEQQIIDAYNKKDQATIQKFNEKLYIELYGHKYHHLFDSNKNQINRFYEKDGFKFEYLIKPDKNKLKWFVRVMYDNKQTDDFKLMIDYKNQAVISSIKWKPLSTTPKKPAESKSNATQPLPTPKKK
ncbi:hypothetical protein RRG51_01115 [Mycoplasmopsis cynos]|uniref:hypothetical protein n=1 Tax=Mycoplasmopsis cynos TaxID=171284 RepID=UPI002AFF7208|nr:hypothetical protein [Mycoplasmopsis cynos]WQQ16351.1 hypothetical protein RRG51_01115 [Mycoplasmopsis cynos]